MQNSKVLIAEAHSHTLAVNKVLRNTYVLLSLTLRWPL